MRRSGLVGRVMAATVLVAVAGGMTGCKSLNERYIALEVWKYEKCFGHYPPGFTPPGAAAAAAPAGRVCGQQPGGCPQAPACDPCQGAMVEGGHPLPPGAGVPMVPGAAAPAAALPTPAGVTSSRPVVISDEVVLP